MRYLRQIEETRLLYEGDCASLTYTTTRTNVCSNLAVRAQGSALNMSKAIDQRSIHDVLCGAVKAGRCPARERSLVRIHQACNSNLELGSCVTA